MDENNSQYRKRESGNAGRCTKSRSEKNYSHKRTYGRKNKRECDENNKTDLQVQNVVNKNSLQGTEVSTEIIPSSTAAACSSKIIDIKMDAPASLSIPTTASSPIPGYRLIDMSILAVIVLDVIVFNVLNFVTLMKKMFYRRKTKEGKTVVM